MSKNKINVKDLPDYDQRLHLAKMIGLDEVPDIDPDGWNKLDGLLDDLFDGEVDAVELVKQVRRRRHYRSAGKRTQEETKKRAGQ